MRGAIKSLWESNHINLNDLFGNNFQTKQQLTGFINGDASSILSNVNTITARKCQELFILCWIHHPTEKGSYMIKFPNNLEDALKTRMANENSLQQRLSTHLAGTAYSAGQNFSFLKGYHELLVQVENKGNSPHLFLKAEGHGVTGDASLASKVKHLGGAIKKTFTGAGNTNNQFLHDLAEIPNSPVEKRAAENFGKGFKKMAKFGGRGRGGLSKTDSLRTTLTKIFTKFKFPHPPLTNVPDGVLSDMISEFLRTKSQSIRVWMPKNGRKAIKDLENIKLDLGYNAIANSQDFIETDQVFREVRVTTAQLDASYATFRNVEVM